MIHKISYISLELVMSDNVHIHLRLQQIGQEHLSLIIPHKGHKIVPKEEKLKSMTSSMTNHTHFDVAPIPGN